MFVQLEVLIRPERIRVELCHRRLDPLCDVRQDLLDAQHPVGVQAVVAIRGRQVGKRVLPRHQHKRHLDRVFRRDLVLQEHLSQPHGTTLLNDIHILADRLDRALIQVGARARRLLLNEYFGPRRQLEDRCIVVQTGRDARFNNLVGVVGELLLIFVTNALNDTEEAVVDFLLVC
ncbi:hypothetical protein BN1723_015007 [Verticillium longisporum]|uniref:Uncharacterized protein n=1 Tax=Verticillium longisporum TaxID=100787 RepID=A0A0G4MN54_VERLO|nr:hypothetical protein BN1723_015007 [Verticillium longisporum]